MKKQWLTVLFLITALTFSGCGEKEEQKEEEIEENNVSTEMQVVEETDMFTNRDQDSSYDEAEGIIISLEGDKASCDSQQVKIDGTTITILDEGTYIVRGTLDDGMLIVEAEDTDKPQIVFDGVSITSKTSAPLYILEADKVFVTLADGTENELKNGGSFAAVDDNNIDGAVFSKQDLTFNGNGSLSVESPSDHGIVCKDDLVFTSGTYTITSASHGIDANDSFRLKEASLTIAAGKDGIHVENSDDTSLGFAYVESGMLNITSEGDGMSAGTYLQVNGGEIIVLAGGGSENGTKTSSDSWGNFGGGMEMPGGHGGPGGRTADDSQTTKASLDVVDESGDSSEDSTSMKGLKAGSDIYINEGRISINSADDGMHSNGSVDINAGEISIKSGDDGIHGEETLDISAGKIAVSESYEGLEALHIVISGGDVDLTASDDGINAAGGTDASGTGGRDKMGGPGGMGMSGNSDGTILISGGDVYINASGDGIDANGSLEISGGYTIVCGPTKGDTATLDYDTSAVITGGTFIGTGSISMAQVFSDAEQGVFAVQCSCAAGSLITLTDTKGNEVISYTPELDFTFVCLSSPEITAGEEYTITVDEVSGTFEAY